MELEVILTIVGAVLAGAAGLFGVGFQKIKNKFLKVGKLAKEIADLVDKSTAALEDNKITKEEIEQLKKELADVKLAWKELFKKEITD